MGRLAFGFDCWMHRDEFQTEGKILHPSRVHVSAKRTEKLTRVGMSRADTIVWV